MTCWPIAFSLTRSMKSRATLKFTSASSNAIRTSRSESDTLDSEIFPRPRRFLKTFCNLPLNESNMAERYGSKLKVQSLNLRVLSGFCLNPRSRGIGLRAVGYPSGQRGQTVNLLAHAFAGSNPSPTTILFPNDNSNCDQCSQGYR